MTEIVWQLPVRATKSNDDWIHPKAKFHAFRKNSSLCGLYFQDTNFFEANIEQSEIENHNALACKKCLSILMKQ